MTQSPRLPPLPDLDWKPDGTPAAQAMDDVYFSVDDGLEETRVVFLAGCGLPQRWTGRTHFTVAELGFGTGLNLLALWQMWKAHRPSPAARLDFVSFEGFPLTRDDAARALARWSELAELSAILLEKWPERARGVQRIELGDGVTLILHIDDVAAALPNAQFVADAWFLDGFAPARNERMWAPEIYPLMIARSAPGAWVGTYTVAGAVRRGLSQAGFEVSKQPGFGRKRERLQATAPEKHAPILAPPCFGGGVPPSKVAVIGAGIAGVCAARAFAARGASTVLFDKAAGLGTGASGNRLALLMPRLDGADTGIARVLIAGYLAALATYRGLPGATLTTVRQPPRNEIEATRFVKLLADPPLPPDMLGKLAGGGLMHLQCLILEPDKLLPALLGSNVETRLGNLTKVDLAARTVDGETFDAIVLANGMGMSAFPETDWLTLAPRLGQVERGWGAATLTEATASGHYALALGQERLWGATFEATESLEPQVTAKARAANCEALGHLVGADWVGDEAPVSRAGIRATTPDKMPIAGRAPDYARLLETHAGLRHGVMPETRVPTHDGIWMLGGLGARGFTFAPWLGEAIGAAAFGEALPLGRTDAELVSPERFVLRALKRGEV